MVLLFGYDGTGDKYLDRHSHEFEVKSGMLVLPKPAGIEPDEWEKAEIAAMKEVVGLYGKTWHTWQVDRGDEVPLGNLVSVPRPQMQLTR